MENKNEKISVKIAITRPLNNSIIICDAQLHFGDSAFLEDIVSNRESWENLEVGVYNAIVNVHAYPSNAPFDPVEYDVDFTLENIEKIDLEKTDVLTKKEDLKE